MEIGFTFEADDKPIQHLGNSNCGTIPFRVGTAEHVDKQVGYELPGIDLLDVETRMSRDQIFGAAYAIEKLVATPYYRRCLLKNSIVRFHASSAISSL